MLNVSFWYWPQVCEIRNEMRSGVTFLFKNALYGQKKISAIIYYSRMSPPYPCKRFPVLISKVFLIDSFISHKSFQHFFLINIFSLCIFFFFFFGEGVQEIFGEFLVSSRYPLVSPLLWRALLYHGLAKERKNERKKKCFMKKVKN